MLILLTACVLPQLALAHPPPHTQTDWGRGGGERETERDREREQSVSFKELMHPSIPRVLALRCVRHRPVVWCVWCCVVWSGVVLPCFFLPSSRRHRRHTHPRIPVHTHTHTYTLMGVCLSFKQHDAAADSSNRMESDILLHTMQGVAAFFWARALSSPPCVCVSWSLLALLRQFQAAVSMSMCVCVCVCLYMGVCVCAGERPVAHFCLSLGRPAGCREKPMSDVHALLYVHVCCVGIVVLLC